MNCWCPEHGEVTGRTEDEGIGRFECHGHVGVDKRLAVVCEFCGGPVYDDPGCTQLAEPGAPDDDEEWDHEDNL